MEKIEVILTDCIEEIKSGRATLAQCLQRYPSRRQDLEPLLKMALNIQEPPPFQLDPAYKQSARSQLLRQIRTAPPARARSFSDVFSFGLPQSLVWVRVVAAVVIGIIVISLLGGSTAYAAQSSLPGELLYPVKMGTEEVRLWVAGDTAVKAELNLEFARIRLVEMNKLAARHSNKTELALKGYTDNLQAAEINTRSITDTAALVAALARLSQKLEQQISFCDNLLDANSEANDSIQAAGALAVDQQINTLTRLANQDNLQAAQLNFNMMQNRSQQAQANANEHQYQTMQKVMLQYQQFNALGQQILQNAQTTQTRAGEIDDLTAQVLPGCLEILNSIFKQVPQEYKNLLENSQTMTLQFQKQARYGYQNRERSNQPPDVIPSANDSGTAPKPGPSAVSQPDTSIPASTPATNTGSGNGAGSSPSAPPSTSGTGGTPQSGGGTGSGSAGSTDSGSGSGSGSSPSALPPTSGTGGTPQSGGGTGSTGSTDSGSGSGSSPPAPPATSGTGGNTQSSSGTGSAGSTDSGSGSGSGSSPPAPPATSGTSSGSSGGGKR